MTQDDEDLTDWAKQYRDEQRRDEQWENTVMALFALVPFLIWLIMWLFNI